MPNTHETLFAVELIRTPPDLSSADVRSPSRFSSQVLIGRSAECDVRILHNTISRRHIDLRADSEGFHVHNLSSRGTTLANHTAMEAGEIRTIPVDQFYLQVGAFLLSVMPAPLTEPYSRRLHPDRAPLLDINTNRRVPLMIAGEPVTLAPIPARALSALAERTGQVISFDDILNAIDDDYGEYGGGNVNQIVSYIRNGLKDAIVDGHVDLDEVILACSEPDKARELRDDLTRLMQYVVQNHYKRGYSLNLKPGCVHVSS